MKFAVDGAPGVFAQNIGPAGRTHDPAQTFLLEEREQFFLEFRIYPEPKAPVAFPAMILVDQTARMHQHGRAGQPGFQDDNAKAFVEGWMAERHRAGQGLVLFRFRKKPDIQQVRLQLGGGPEFARAGHHQLDVLPRAPTEERYIIQQERSAFAFFASPRIDHVGRRKTVIAGEGIGRGLERIQAHAHDRAGGFRQVIQPAGQRAFRFLPGPIFANIILADEINRTPPKTQAALLEAMQEHQVTAGGKRHPMKEPFFVLATQNPIEQEGTYPLPEAQQDRFMFKIFVRYPKWDEELSIIKLTTAGEQISPMPVLSGAEILALQQIVRRVPIADHLVQYAMKLVRLTRVSEPEEAADFAKQYVSWGAGPRATQFLVLGAKARALLKGRFHVAAEDIQAVAAPVLRHRIITNFTANSEGVTPDVIVERLIKETPAHESEAMKEPAVKAAFKS